MRSVIFLTLYLLLPACPALAAAQNLIPFASFDSSSDLTDGWGNLGGGKVWASTDVDGSSSSGSLLIINDLASGAGVLAWSTCVAVDEGQAYDFGAWYVMQIFQPGSGFARVTLQWFDSCGGSFTGDDDAAVSTVEGDWTQIEGHGVAPPGAGGARLQLVNGKFAGSLGEERKIYFDEAFLPEPGGATVCLSVVVTLALLRRGSRRAAASGPAFAKVA